MFARVRGPIVATRAARARAICSREVTRTVADRRSLEPEYDLAKRTRELGVALSPEELRGLSAYADQHGDSNGHFTRSDFVALVRGQRDHEAEREALCRFITMSSEDSIGQRTLLGMDYLATSLFAAVGTIIAGQAGMNIIGTTVVGAVASMGGGTVNNVLTGNTRGGGARATARATTPEHSAWPRSVSLLLARSMTRPASLAQSSG